MKIDHVGVAVRSLDEAVAFYRTHLALVETHREEVPGQKVRVAFLSDPADPEGTAVELLEPTSPDGAVAKFIAARGLGMHHLAFDAGHGAGRSPRPWSACMPGRPALENARGRRARPSGLLSIPSIVPESGGAGRRLTPMKIVSDKTAELQRRLRRRGLGGPEKVSAHKKAGSSPPGSSSRSSTRTASRSSTLRHTPQGLWLADKELPPTAS